jgi:hypothetical protein
MQSFVLEFHKHLILRLTEVLFIWLIIRLIQLVFSAGTVFFSHEKSANSVFQPAYNSSRTAPKFDEPHGNRRSDQLVLR